MSDKDFYVCMNRSTATGIYMNNEFISMKKVMNNEFICFKEQTKSHKDYLQCLNNCILYS